MAGAQPLALSLGLVIEEGFALSELARVIDSMAQAARAAGVPIVTGDTKVVEKGKGDGLFVNRSEEHTSELQSLMRISYAVFCLKKKKHRPITCESTAQINAAVTSLIQTSHDW